MVLDSGGGVAAQVSDVIREHFSDATIYMAADSREAKGKMDNVPPNIVITDSDLPSSLSLELVQYIINNKSLRNTYVIVLSDIPDRNEFMDGVGQGRVKIVLKPIDSNELLLAVSKVLEQNMAQNEQGFIIRYLSAGEILFREGDKAESAFLIKKGKLMASKTKDGKNILLGEAVAGEFIGEMAHINGEPRSANMEVVESCELVEVPLGTLDTLLFSKPVWSKALMRTLAKRLKNSQR